MRNIDSYSYQCGVIDCFNEMVYAGVKSLALSHPMDSAEERDALLPYARELCQRYGNQLYIEDEPCSLTCSPCPEPGQAQHPVLPGRPCAGGVSAPEGAQGSPGGGGGLLRRQPQPGGLGVRAAAVLSRRVHPPP